jgi:preprotein translocase subunit SecB
MKIKGMKKPPLQMEFYYFQDINVRINQEIPVDKISPDKIGLGIDLEPKSFLSESDPLRYKVELRIKAEEIKGKIKPYEIDVLAVGFFSIEKDVPKEKRGGIVSVLGANLLYGAARELIFQLTARSPFQPVYLPTTSFVPEEKDAKLASQKSGKAASPKPKKVLPSRPR